MQETTLEGKITRALRDSDHPLRAVDLSRMLTTTGRGARIVSKDAVNRALYRGPFEKVDVPGAPVWKVRDYQPVAGQAGHFTFQVGSVGTFCLNEDLSREATKTVLMAALGLVPPGEAPVVRVDGTDGGKVVAELAEGLAEVVDLAP